MVRFVKIKYTGKVKDTGNVFDTTQKDVAEKAGLNMKGRHFGATPMIAEDNKLIKGFDKALKDMKKGDEKTVVIESDNAYGPRKQELVQLVPASVFKKANQKPVPGMVVVFDNNMTGRVQSVSGGRVRIDFNHELAGKTLEFWIELEEEIEKENDKINAMYEMVFPGLDSEKLGIKKDGKALTLTLQKELSKLKDLSQRKKIFTDMIKNYLDVDKVVFSEEY